MQEVRIFCSRILSGSMGAGFANRIDDGHGVYIPASVVGSSGIKEHSIATAKIIPNTHSNNKDTPWVAVYVDKSGKEDLTFADDPVLEAGVISVVSGSGYATTDEISGEVNATPQRTQAALLSLFRKGQMAKADVYGKAGLEEPSFTLWALSADEFTA
jgi:hypothetical protein